MDTAAHVGDREGERVCVGVLVWLGLNVGGTVGADEGANVGDTV